MKLLTDEFIAKYPEFPAHMNDLGKSVYYRTYSRWLEHKKRWETWRDTCRRAVEYNVGLAAKHLRKIGYTPDMNELRKEAEELFDSMFNLRQFLSGRTLWVGGAETGVAEKFPLANFNCSFLNISKWDDLGDLFYLLLVGTGVGFKCTKEMARKLAPIRTGTTLTHSEYNPVPKDQRLERTKLRVLENGYAKIYVGDSKEGWVEALRTYFELLTNPDYEYVHTIKISYNSVRPKGSPLKTFGGSASGPEPLREMFEGIDAVLKNKLDPHLAPLEKAEREGYYHVRPIHILDIGNLVGNNVVVGGVRRTAEIFLFDPDDYESMFAKYGINGIWDEERHKRIIKRMESLGIEVPQWMREIKIGDPNARPLHHRRMSNNSVIFERKPSRELLTLIFEMMQAEGEPGFINLEEAQRRRPNADGVNPCAEILLDSYGVCNLTTLNLVSFVKDGVLDLDAAIEAQRRSARAGLRMTLVELELPHWDEVQQRDRLLGTSLTGVKDALAQVEHSDGYSVLYTGQRRSFSEQQILRKLKGVAREEADNYAKKMRVSAPLLVTTVKPEGTLSQVAGGVSSGLHWSHAPYYIRRIRVNAADPFAKVALELGWTVNPEVGTPGETHEERMQNARTLVIDFPVASGAKRTKDDIYIEEQFETYFEFQQHYTEHNSSNTIHVRPDEWGKAEQIVWDRWDEFTGVSFLAYDGGTYQLAPYETITKEQYEEMAKNMKPFDPNLLLKYANHGEEFDIGDNGCESGICPVR